MAQGSKNDTDFAEQDRIEKNKEENDILTVAIERFDNDQEAFKKEQNEVPSEFDDDWTKNLDQLRLKFGFLFESSSDNGSDHDLENSESDGDYVKDDMKKKSLQENQGRITKAEFTDQECNDKIQAEPEDRIEKNEENENLMAGIEQLDRDQETFKKKLNESSSEFDDVEKHLDQLRQKFDSVFESSSDDGSDLGLENSKNAEDYVQEDLKKKSLQENQGTITKVEFTDQECNDKVEAEPEDVDEKLKDQSNHVTQSDFQSNIAELKEQLYKLRRELKSDRESVALELNHQIELQTRVTGKKEMVKAKYLQLILELAAQHLSTFEAQLEIFDRAQVSINDLLKEPVDQELRDEIDSDIESRMQNTKAKKESRLNYQIGGGAEDSKKTIEEDELKGFEADMVHHCWGYWRFGSSRRQTGPELVREFRMHYSILKYMIS